MKIVVTEYPKSGGSWVTSMLGDALQLPKRDIYVAINERAAFDLRKHPWYKDDGNPQLVKSCIIKSHEHPQSKFITFPARFVHVVRDGRDVVVSKYFYERDFCVKNGIYDQFDVPFDEYMLRIAEEWCEYVAAWLEIYPNHFYRYEDFLQSPFATLRAVFEYLEVDVTDLAISRAVETNTKEKMGRSLDQAFKYNTFVRKGIAGDWHNHLTVKQATNFKQIAGSMLIRLGYEKDLEW